MATSAHTLYNGIRLPETWPPRYPRELFEARRPLPVPYLEDPPEVIPLGRGRELFVDDFLIESTSCVRSFHYPEKYAGNPVLAPETDLERGGGRLPACACPKSGGVWFDRERNVFRMWYEAGFLGVVCCAESADGLHWTRPEFDVFPGTNRVLPAGLRCDSWTVVPDYAADPAQRYKMFLMEPCASTARGMVMTSPDGVHWGLPTATGCAGDRSTMFYNPFTGKWCFSLRSYASHPLLRMRDYAEGDDFLSAAQWGAGAETRAVPWAGVDADDPPLPGSDILPQLYNLDAVPYESLMLGVFQLHYGPPNEECEKTGFPKTTGLEFAYSRDGFHWHRPDRRCAILPSPGDTWDRGYVQSLGNVCTVWKDRIVFYYAAFSGAPGAGKKFSMYENGATGAAFLRRDGFASLDAAETGEVVTRKVVFGGEKLFVNLDAPRGELRAEVLTPDGKVVPGFSAAECRAVTGDSTKAELSWKNAGLHELKGQVVRFRFLLNGGSLYSFWVGNNHGGSGGYVAGGSPDHRSSVDA